MRIHLLKLSMCILFGISTGLNAQYIQAPDAAEKSGETFPVHVSDMLNTQPWVQELNRSNSDINKRRTAKIVVNEEGDEEDFYVYNLETEEYDSKTFKLMKKGNLTQIWFEVEEMNNGHLNEDGEVADSIFKYLETESNEYSYDPNRGIIELSNDILGNPPDYDGDGLVDFLITDIQDGWDPEEGGGYTAGFFYSVDQAQDDSPALYRSNERDILYIDSYPGIFSENNPDRPITSFLSSLLSTLSHEYQHLIHYNYNGAEGSNEYTFINEAQSNFAALLNGYFPHTSWPRYLDDTNVPIFRWDRDNVLADYGRAASFASYLWDQLGFENSGYLTQDQASGVTGINNSISNSGSSLTFDELLVNWGIANLINDNSLESSFGYDHTFLDELTVPITFENPNISNRTVEVEQGGIAYIGFQEVENLNINAEFSGSNAQARIITRLEGTTEIHTLENSTDFTTSEDEIYEEVYIMLVNTSPSPRDSSNSTTLDYTLNVSGEQMYDYNTLSTYGQESNTYWSIPYESTSGARLGFSNKFTAQEEGLLYSLELFILTGTNASGDAIEVKGDGQLRMAFYSDDEGVPGTELEADTVDFDQLTSGWQTFNVMDWEMDLEQEQEFHIVYETIVPTIDTEDYAVPLRLDNGSGDQNVTHILTGPEQYVSMFSVDENSSNQHGVFNRIVIAQAVNIDEESLTEPLTFELNQNYPNPFNPSTNINFKLPQSAEVELTIYTALGQKISTLVSEKLSSGSHTVNWNAAGLASGVYLYKIQAGDFVQTRKMILLK